MFPTRWAGSLAAVTLPAELDLANADDLRQHLGALIEVRPRTLVVDMTRTTFCDSVTIATLIRASQQAASRDIRVRLAASYPVLRLLRLLEADRLVEVTPSLAEALGEAVPGQPPQAPREAREPG